MTDEISLTTHWKTLGSYMVMAVNHSFKETKPPLCLVTEAEFINTPCRNKHEEGLGSLICSGCARLVVCDADMEGLTVERLAHWVADSLTFLRADTTWQRNEEWGKGGGRGVGGREGGRGSGEEANNRLTDRP